MVEDPWHFVDLGGLGWIGYWYGMGGRGRARAGGIGICRCFNAVLGFF